MQKGNVLVIGNSGVGKSTLINAVLGEDVAKTSWGEKGITSQLDIYEGEPFNVIDTIGFEPSIFKSNKAINAVKKWSKKSAKEENEDTQINVIWFCVDGTSRKLFPKAIKDLSKAISMWKSVPIVTVITKSYSVPERDENIELVNGVFAKNKELTGRLKAVIPVVASTYVLNDMASAPPEGITELIEKTNELMPDGMRAAQKDIAKFNLLRKRALAQGAIMTATGTAVVKTFINFGGSDSAVLTTVESVLIETIARIYNIDKTSEALMFIKGNIVNGNVNTIAKTAISAVEKIPKVDKLGSMIINPLIAASVVIVIGETAVIAFEKIYLGEDVDEGTKKFKEIFELEYVKEFVENIKSAADTLTEKSEPKDIAQAATNVFAKNTKKSEK